MLNENTQNKNIIIIDYIKNVLNSLSMSFDVINTNGIVTKYSFGEEKYEMVITVSSSILYAVVKFVDLDDRYINLDNINKLNREIVQGAFYIEKNSELKYRLSQAIKIMDISNESVDDFVKRCMAFPSIGHDMM